MGLIKRKADENGESKVSKGKVGAVGGIAGILAVVLSKKLGFDVPAEELAALLGGIGALISLWGIRDKQEREGA